MITDLDTPAPRRGLLIEPPPITTRADIRHDLRASAESDANAQRIRDYEHRRDACDDPWCDHETLQRRIAAGIRYQRWLLKRDRLNRLRRGWRVPTARSAAAPAPVSNVVPLRSRLP